MIKCVSVTEPMDILVNFNMNDAVIKLLSMDRFVLKWIIIHGIVQIRMLLYNSQFRLVIEYGLSSVTVIHVLESRLAF
jgi:hypothetical protein